MKDFFNMWLKWPILTVVRDIYRHRFTYLLRASLLHVVMTFGGVYCLSLLFRMVLIGSNLPGLTTDNLMSFLLNPISLAFLFIYLLILSLFIFVEFSVLAALIRLKEHPVKREMRQLFSDGWLFVKSLFSWHLWLI